VSKLLVWCFLLSLKGTVLAGDGSRVKMPTVTLCYIVEKEGAEEEEEEGVRSVHIDYIEIIYCHIYCCT